MKNTSFILVVGLLALGVMARFVPHAANFTPIGAIALFGGLYLPRRWAVVLPLAALFASDLIIGFYSFKMMAAVYASFALMAGIGLLVRRRKNFATVAAGTLAGSLAFFLITNAAVWAFGTMYPSTLGGLMASYTNALPFFRNSLAGDIFYVAVLVGGMEAVRAWVASRAPKLATKRAIALRN
ncbi:MAG: DUF6580 family putative transport protein [Candidatus Spechtbacterales bacterium]